MRKSERYGHKITSEIEKVTHRNLANYLYDSEAIAKETGELGNLKITYVLNKAALQLRYELHHRIHPPQGQMGSGKLPS